MSKLLVINLNSFIGSVLRYLVSGYVQQISQSRAFPYGTLVVNVVGCFIIGFLSHLAEAHGFFSAEARAFIFIGILGGFTTFSTFGNESLNLLREGENFPALVNIGAHILLGLGAVWLGRNAASVIWR